MIPAWAVAVLWLLPVLGVVITAYGAWYAYHALRDREWLTTYWAFALVAAGLMTAYAGTVRLLAIHARVFFPTEVAVIATTTPIQLLFILTFVGLLLGTWETMAALNDPSTSDTEDDQGTTQTQTQTAQDTPYPVYNPAGNPIDVGTLREAEQHLNSADTDPSEEEYASNSSPEDATEASSDSTDSGLSSPGDEPATD